MNKIDIIIISLIILISVQLITDYITENTESFAEIPVSEKERDALFMYREWLKENESKLYGIHTDNFIV